MSPAGSYGHGWPENAGSACLERAVQDHITNARRRVTAPDLEREIARREGCPRSLVRSAVRGLIEKEIIEYRYSLGQSYLALSFRRPVDVSPLFTIFPPGCRQQPAKDRIPIILAPGASFGDGRHPTTRLALAGLEKAWNCLGANDAGANPVVLDIGTGTGVLAIAASALGARQVTALDVDACARTEARQNIRLNSAAGKIAVMDRPFTSIDMPFDIVMANLRLPTLIELGEWMQVQLKSTGCAVVSGCREEEWDSLADAFTGQGLHCLWHEALTGWAGGLFRKAPMLVADHACENSYK